MKKTYITLVFLCAMVFSANAQDSSSPKSTGGIKGGYNLASVNFDGNGETDQRNGFHVGVYGESFVSNSFSIQPELMYSQQGYKITNANGTFTQKLDYINLPIMLKAYPSKNFFLEAGPQIGLAISHKEVYEGFITTTQEFEPKKFDYGVNFGAGIKTDSGISIGVRYHLGLGDLYDSNDKAFNRVLQFSLGFDL